MLSSDDGINHLCWIGWDMAIEKKRTAGMVEFKGKRRRGEQAVLEFKELEFRR